MTRRNKKGASLPAGARIGRPIVAIVGRPNVGKSTLFNKIAGDRLAIVEDRPGVTRDRHYADAWVLGHAIVLIDTGGFDPDSDDPMQQGITNNVRLALSECDVVVCVLDATTDPMPADREAVKLLRHADKPVIFVTNKADSNRIANESTTYYELGLEKIIPVSALHSRGLGDLEEAIALALPKSTEVGQEDLSIPRIALVGKPNAGKSSLANRLLGEERQLVDSRPGTTVDSIDAIVDRDGQRFVLIDTAGMRRQSAVEKEGTEAMSVFQAIRAMERSHVVVLMIDAQAGAAEQDAKIAGLAVDRGRGLIIALNKSDLLTQDELGKAIDKVRDVLSFVPWAPVFTLSAKTGKGSTVLLGRIADAVAAHDMRISTGELNRFFEEVLERHPPPTMHGRETRLYFITQAEVRPPTFVIITNEPEGVHFSYQRYVVNQIRERFGFRGTPIRVRYRHKNRDKDED